MVSTLLTCAVGPIPGAVEDCSIVVKNTLLLWTRKVKKKSRHEAMMIHRSYYLGDVIENSPSLITGAIIQKCGGI
jgi:hypothetical protein